MALMATRDAQKEEAPRTGCSEGPQTTGSSVFRRDAQDLDQLVNKCKPGAVIDSHFRHRW